MIKPSLTSTKKHIVKTVVAAEKDVHSSNETDDEVEQIENST